MKQFFTLLLVFISFWGNAQESTEKISITFSDVTLKQVISEIENKSPYRFFFLEEWLPERRISGSFREKEVDEILEELLRSTDINYIFMGDRVIFTHNSVVYDELPENFFGAEVVDKITESTEQGEEGSYNPVFNVVTEEPKKKELETVYIGKAEKRNKANFFTLSGVVKNAENGEPISNLAISVKGRNLGAVTGENGYYELKLPAGVNIIETSSLGNEDITRRVVIYNNGKLDLELEEDFEQLSEVLLESDADSNVKDAVSGAEEINVEEVKNIPLVLGERDILKVSTTLPGISSAGEGAAGFNVRGGRADQNLILLDDAVIYNPSHFFGIFSGINPFTTGKVDIYKGNMPAEFGGRLSSVFDIKTKQADQTQIGGEASFGPVTSNLTLSVPVVQEKAGLLVGGRSTYSDWILRSLDEESLKNSEASFYDIVAGYDHKVTDKTSIKGMGYYSKDKFSITSDSLYHYSNRLFSFQLNHKFNDFDQGSISVANSNYNFNIDYDSEFNNNFTSGYSINETAVKLQVNSKLNEKHRLTYGISGKVYLVDPGEIRPEGKESSIETLVLPQEKGIEGAIFASDEFTLSERLLLYAGVRYSGFAALGERSEKIYEEGRPRSETSVIDTITYGNNELIKSYGGPEFRISGRYLLQEDLSVKVSYNTSFQYIHTLSNNTTASPTDTYKLSNSVIKPQRGSQYSLGFYKNLFSNTYEISTEGYYKLSEDILDYKVGAQLFLNEDIETEVLQGKGKSYGVELLLKKTKGDLNGWLGYSYSRSFIQLDGEFKEEKVNNGEYFPANFDKPHDFSLVANYKLTQRFSLSANFIYQTGRPITYPIGKYNYNGAEYVMYSDRNQYRIPDYFRLDLGFNVEGNHKIKKFAHSFWNISVYNVLGRNNPYSVFFVTEDGEVKAYQSSIFSIPIPTITYNFKF